MEKNDVLFINQYGIPEPSKSKVKIPDVILVPILAFDKNKYRLGYGKGFYDRYLNKYLKRFKKILTVGVAFSFQRHHKLPRNQNDVKLDLIITEKDLLMNILILGDIMGASGRKALFNNLPKLIQSYKINFVIVNGENASDDGRYYKRDIRGFFKIGVDVITSGNTFGIKKKL